MRNENRNFKNGKKIADCKLVKEQFENANSFYCFAGFQKTLDRIMLNFRNTGFYR